MVYVLVFLMNALFELAELAIKKDMPVAVVVRLLVFLMPRVLEMALPMAVLLGVLIGIGRLSADSEVIALRASGVSYRRVLSPVLALALACWALSSWLILKVEPAAKLNQRRLYTEQLYSADLRREIKPRVFFEEVPGLLMYADDVYQGGDFLERVFLHQTDPEGREVVTLARRAQIEYDRGAGVAEFFLESGTNHTITPEEPESYQISHFDRQKFVRGPDESFKMKLNILSRSTSKNYAEQNLTELRGSAKTAESIEHLPTRMRVIGAVDVVFQERFALPFACIAFALIGLPLGIANRRGGRASGFSLSIGITILYWLLYTTGQNLVREGKLPPIVGMWAANGVLTVLGIVLLIMRERSEGLHLEALFHGRLAGVTGTVSGWIRPLISGSVPAGPGEVSLDEEAEAKSTRGFRPAALLLGGVLVMGGLASIYLTPFLMVALVLAALVLLFGSTLDRHVLRRYLATLAGCMLSFFTLYVVYQFIELLDDIARLNQPIGLAFACLGYRVPFALAQVLPMSCLMACLLTFGIMSRFNEVTAVKASGTSIYRLAMPVIIVTLAISILSYVNYDYLVPHAEQKAMQIKDVIRGRSPRSLQTGNQRWLFGGGGRLYNFSNYVPPPLPVLPSAGAGTFQRFSVFRLDTKTFQMTGRIYAREATFKTGVGWVLRDGWMRDFSETGELFERFTEKHFDFEESPGFFIREWKTPQQMNFAELRLFVNDLTRRGYDAQELRVDLYSKTSFPLVPLTLVIIGLPFCFRMGRRGSLYGVGIAILLAAIYFLTFSATSALGGTGLMPAFLAAWSPNILFAGVGSYLLLRTPT